MSDGNKGKRYLTVMRILSTGTAFAGLMAGVTSLSTPAFAKTEDEAYAEVVQAEASVADTQARIEQISRDIDGAKTRAAELQGSMPAMRERASRAMKAMYKASPDMPLGLSVILDAYDADELIVNIQALESLGQANVDALVAGRAELDSSDERVGGLMSELSDAQSALAQAEDDLGQAEALLSRIQDAPPAIDGCEPIDWSLSDDEIVNEWAPRIDAFLAGHALSGYGEAFVRSGLKYGVDPRFAAAISMTESTGGDFCFESYNAFGYMGASRYTSFYDSIDEISEYLTCDFYHARLDAATAQTYCPPTWDSWLSRTLGYAQSI